MTIRPRSEFDRAVDRLDRQLEREIAQLERDRLDEWPDPAADLDDEATEPWARRDE